MNSKSKEVSCLTGWSANEPEENLTPKALTATEKMLHTSRLYLKAGQTKTESDSNPPAKIGRSNETPIHQ
jgi:hypothetical protein